MFSKTCLLTVIILSASGCGGKLEDVGHKVKSFFGMVSGPSPKAMTRNAFDDTVDPDLRREAVISLSSHDWGLTETYLDGYDVILRAEMRKPRDQRDLALMSATIGALGRGKNPKYIPILTLALKLAFSPQVRWDAAVALDSVVGNKAVAQLCASSHPNTEDSADVRAASCRALRHYRRQSVVDTLVNSLVSSEDFTVRYQAHATLVQLCGRDYGLGYTDWVGAKLEPLPVPIEDKNQKTTKKKSMWNPLNWFR
ncbi:MAG: HEAT repeat domain-containing protein [bacterium]|nr:HEAT repeat domain-containing protein [bacterium]